MSKFRHSPLGWTAQEERRFREATPAVVLMAQPVEAMEAAAARCAALALEAKAAEEAHLRASGGLLRREHVAAAGACLEWRRAMGWWSYTLSAICEWRRAAVTEWPAQLAVFAGVRNKSYSTPSNTVIEYEGQCLVRDAEGVLWCGTGQMARGVAAVIFGQGRIIWTRMGTLGAARQEVTP